MGAIGLLEVHGYSVAMAAIDSACKTADVTVAGIDANNPLLGDAARIPIVVQVKFCGDVSNVKAALEAGRQAALKHNETSEISTHLIANGADGLQPLLKLGKVVRQ